MNKGKFPHDKKHQKTQWPGHGPQKPPHNPGHGGQGTEGNPNKPQWPDNKDKR
jgi:hypothetical protein